VAREKPELQASEPIEYHTAHGREKGPESQREVQRLLGRCLLRLQQNEQFLKSLIARSEISGAVHEIESRLAERAAEVEKLTPDTP